VRALWHAINQGKKNSDLVPVDIRGI
jgi:hypothetical protein